MYTHKGFVRQCSMYIVVLNIYGVFVRLYIFLKQMTLPTFVVILICNLIIKYIIL